MKKTRFKEYEAHAGRSIEIPAGEKLTLEWLTHNEPEENPWSISTTRIEGELAREVILGNGYLGVTVGAEGTGGYTNNLAPSRIAGLWTTDRLILPPDFTPFKYHDGLSEFSRHNGRLHNYTQRLNLREGSCTTQIDWSSEAGRRSEIEITICPLRHDSRILFQEMCLTPHFDGHSSVEDALDGRRCEGVDAWMNRRMEAAHVRDEQEEAARDHLRGGGGETGESGDLLAFGCPLGMNRQTIWMIARINTDSEIFERTEWHSLPGAFVRRHHFSAQKGKSIRIRRMVLVQEEIPGKSSLSDTCQDLENLDWDTELKAHHRAMNDLWRRVPEVQYPRLQCLLNTSYHHLFNAIREDQCVGLAPLGLAGKRWRGSTFWDADAWIHPALLDSHPELAATIPRFRRATLAAAVRLAQIEGHPGAAYPWMARCDGEEVCHLETFRKERHVSNSVVLAAFRQWEAGDDENWLSEVLWPIVREVATYWVSRAEPDGVKFHFSGLCGPDEAAGCVNDNAYTMGTTSEVIRLAILISEQIGETVPPKWHTVRLGLNVPWDSAHDIPREHVTYDGETIKQADTILLAYPWNYYNDPELVLRISRYYRRRYPENPIMMTHPVDGIIEARYGEPDAARESLGSMLESLHGPYMTMAESATPMLYPFLTGYGGLIRLIRETFK